MPGRSPAAALAARRVALQHQERTAAIRAAQTAKVIAAWRELNPDSPVRSWLAGVSERVYVAVASGQEAVAGLAEDYVRDVLEVQDILADVPPIDARQFAGIASDGRDLESLLTGAPIRTSLRRRQGQSPAQAMQSGEAWLRMAVSTQINDAARAADSVGIAAGDFSAMTETDRQDRDQRAPTPPSIADPGRPNALQRARQERTDRQGMYALSTDRAADVARRKQATLDRIERERAERRAARARPERAVNSGARSRREVSVGYIRLLNPPSCDRCVVLAGRFYKWSDGFERHLMCDCFHTPAGVEVVDSLLTDPQEYFNSLSAADQDAYFGKANAQAIRAGADLTRVVNARSGITTADDGRRYNRRPQGRKRRGPPVLRPTVWQIYKDARGDRDRARAALDYNGYIVGSA